MAKRNHEINALHTKDAEEDDIDLIKDLYIKHNIELPLNPIFRVITQPKAGAGFRTIIERDRYIIYSKKVRDNTYVKFYYNFN